MANEKDSLGILAQDIVDSVKTGSTSITNKAQYDKSYKCTIIGVNKRFTKDVPAEKQTELIAKYSVPDEVEGDSYYFFKINGIYYCLQSNTDFKLYDEVNVRVPNNNWNKMFIETGKGEGGGTSENYNFTLLADGWSWISNSYQDVQCSWATTDQFPIFDLDCTSISSEKLLNYNLITCIYANNGSIRARCFGMSPTVDLVIRAKVI